jgi:1-phosphatidylinositol-4-phosphate 5-kinase
LLNLDGITDEDIGDSLSLIGNYKSIFKAGEGSGKSGSFFFFSHDKRFLIKTLQGDEKKKMLLMLDSYLEHIKISGGKSLLARIYGIFTFKSNYFKNIDVILMENTARVKKKCITFDLKGSLLYRRASYRADGSYPSLMKDVNFL